MTVFDLPWLELAVLAPLAGAALVGRVRDPDRASRWCLGFTGVALAAAVLAWAGHALRLAPPGGGPLGPYRQALGGPALGVDDLSAPLLPVVALLHFLTALATARTKMTRFSFGWLLAGEALRLGTLACLDPWVLVGLLVLNTLPPYFELARRGRPTRVYVVHMAGFAGLLLFGHAAAAGEVPLPAGWAAAALFAAVLIRCGAVPAHVWVVDLFEAGSFGTAVLFVTPITGVYAAARLVVPIAPDWVLQGLGAVSLVTAVYAAGLAVVQTDARRFFAFLFLSHASLVLVGLELHTPVSLAGAFALWVSVALSLGGLGLTLRALEARLGRLTLDAYRGLYDHSPALAVCFLLTGLGSVGFPGTLGFIAAEVLVDGAIHANPFVGVTVVLAAALNGIAVVRAYLLLFTGRRYAPGVSLRITGRERVAVLTLAALVLGGGLLPQPGMAAGQRAADAVRAARDARQPAADAGPHPGPG